LSCEPGRTHAERRQIIDHTLEALRHRNLASRNHPPPRLAAMLGSAPAAVVQRDWLALEQYAAA